jgi:hypothetical protein
MSDEAPSTRGSLAPIVAGGLVAWVAVAAWFASAGFEVVRSDAAEYVRWSHHWWRVESTTHIPGFPLTQWLMRAVTLGVLPDAVLARAASLIGWLAGVWAANRVVSSLAPSAVAPATLLYAMFPFVGITYTVFPVSDSFALAVLMLTVLAMLRGQWAAFAAGIAFGLVVHKALWPAYGLLGVFAVATRGAPVWSVVVAVVPLLGWYAWGYTTHSGLWWLNRHVDAQLTYSHLPVLDGLLGPALEGTPNKLAKVAVNVSTFVIAVAATIWAVRRRRWWLVALAFPTVFWMVILNEHVIWAAVRFARPVVVPVAVWVAEERPTWAAAASRPIVLVAVGVVLALTQLAYAWFMTDVFFG